MCVRAKALAATSRMMLAASRQASREEEPPREGSSSSAVVGKLGGKAAGQSGLVCSRHWDQAGRRSRMVL